MSEIKSFEFEWMPPDPFVLPSYEDEVYSVPFDGRFLENIMYNINKYREEYLYIAPVEWNLYRGNGKIKETFVPTAAIPTEANSKLNNSPVSLFSTYVEDIKREIEKIIVAPDNLQAHFARCFDPLRWENKRTFSTPNFNWFKISDGTQLVEVYNFPQDINSKTVLGATQDFHYGVEVGGKQALVINAFDTLKARLNSEGIPVFTRMQNGEWPFTKSELDNILEMMFYGIHLNIAPSKTDNGDYNFFDPKRFPIMLCSWLIQSLRFSPPIIERFYLENKKLYNIEKYDWGVTNGRSWDGTSWNGGARVEDSTNAWGIKYEGLISLGFKESTVWDFGTGKWHIAGKCRHKKDGIKLYQGTPYYNYFEPVDVFGVITSSRDHLEFSALEWYSEYEDYTGVPIGYPYEYKKSNGNVELYFNKFKQPILFANSDVDGINYGREANEKTIYSYYSEWIGAGTYMDICIYEDVFLGNGIEIEAKDDSLLENSSYSEDPINITHYINANEPICFSMPNEWDSEIENNKAIQEIKNIKIIAHFKQRAQGGSYPTDVIPIKTRGFSLDVKAFAILHDKIHKPEEYFSYDESTDTVSYNTDFIGMENVLSYRESHIDDFYSFLY